MTEAQAKLIVWFRNHASAQDAAGNRERALKVILGAVETARRQVNLEAGEGRHLFAVLLDAGVLALHSQKNELAKSLLNESLALAENGSVELTSEELAETRQRLGVAMDNQGDEEGAAEQFEICLELLTNLENPPLDSLAHLANNLGMIRRNQARFDESASLYRQAQDIFESMGDSHALDLATVCNNQGSLFWAWNQQELARDFHLVSLKLRMDHLPPGHPDIGQSACNLAAVYHELGDLEKARRNYERALAILKRHLSEDPDTYEIAARNFADLLTQSGHPQKAEKFLRVADKRIARARSQLDQANS